MVNWTNLLVVNPIAVKSFANEDISGRAFYAQFIGSKAGGDARKTLRKYGVAYGRRLARKALRRRSLI